MMIICNFTPAPRHNYHIGVPRGGFWHELLNSDAERYGGSQQGNMGGLDANPVAHHGHFHSLTLTLPPLAILFLKNKIVAPAEEVR
jgi:1,4-alpha-glucan branching enzyme